MKSRDLKEVDWKVGRLPGAIGIRAPWPAGARLFLRARTLGFSVALPVTLGILSAVLVVKSSVHRASLQRTAEAGQAGSVPSRKGEGPLDSRGTKRPEDRSPSSRDLPLLGIPATLPGSPRVEAASSQPRNFAAAILPGAPPCHVEAQTLSGAGCPSGAPAHRVFPSFPALARGPPGSSFSIVAA